MKICKKLFVGIGFYFLSISASAESIYRSYSPGRLELDFTFDYFKSNSNFQSDGSKTALPSSNYFQEMNFISVGRYVFTENIGLIAGLDINSAESNDFVAKRTNSSISYVHLGADYRLLQASAWDLSAEFSYSHPVEKVDDGSDSVLNSDGAAHVRGSLISTLRWGGFLPFIKGGIDYRTEGLSTLFTYSAGAEVRFDKMYFGGAITGYMTVKEDEKTDRAFEREALTNRVSGGSKRYYSVNPNLTDSEIYLKYNIDGNLVLKFFGGYTLVGSNTAEGFRVGGGITWGFGGDSNHSRPTDTKKPNRPSTKKPSKPVTIDPSERGFVEDVNDGVNQDYFKPVVPTKDNYIEQIDGTSVDQAPEEPTIEMKKKPVLNPATEKDYKIQLKKKKKKKKN